MNLLYPPENLEMLALTSRWNFCTSLTLSLHQHNPNVLRERGRKMSCVQKSSKVLLLWIVEDTCGSDRWLLPPFQDRNPKLPADPEKGPTDKVKSFLRLSKKMDFLSFHCGWKCNISVCNFNFTADWHLQRQRILIKLQKHLIQWLADGERVGSSSIFLTMLTKHGVCFPNAPTLFFIYDLNSVMKNRD